ncbi:hypothetical protein NLC82_04210 [Candidatus Aminicenantes bacterium AC-335-A11]|jgi:hypothetical protein|nr:hypothetical protein [SCandidatus Aminicenantes bacterium Aminicenantia_JdfR_composite]MCP2597126.1 hypothetical protein [Candidatus Aminicenantes bacterium AC-335-G13]MCP2606455.1 hypothetical protein [Candidatus Aminicenantes bacterium AC-708-I09]MCP2618605.1 hypothetical protein [Candidatus Aminicenantes bacterium AC-335-A11]
MGNTRKLIFLSFFFLLFLFNLLLSEDFEIGAFDPPFWNGLVIVKNKSFYAFRFIIHKGKDKADGYDTFYLVEDVGPFSPNASYAELSFNPFLPFHMREKTPIFEKNGNRKKLLNIKFGKYMNGIVGKIEVPKRIELEILFYTPWGKKKEYYFSDGIVRTNSNFVFVPINFEIEKIKKDKDKLSLFVKKKFRDVFFYAGFRPLKIKEREINHILEKSKKDYISKRPKIIGEWEGIISSIYNNIAWMKLYQPDKGRVYIPAGRKWIFPKPDGSPDLWTIFEWDAFFNALEASIEDCKLAKQEIEAVLDCQYPWGNIPNWRSAHNGSPDRSQPPVGSFTVLKTYYRCNDISILTESYEKLKKWHEFWKAPGSGGFPRRDGNNDGLLEWGSDGDKVAKGVPKWEKGADGRQRAAWESGQDDLPNFDNIPFDEQKGTLKMNCIDLSSLYALDCEMLMKIAEILEKKEDKVKFKKEYEEIKKKINEILWNKDFYYDRFWDGRFSHHKASSNFYPLIAGIPNEKRAKLLLKHLLNEEEFWGEYVIPTISRDNPTFKDQQYWRGTIWPPTNYLIYQGLKRYKFDEVASEFAKKSAKLFLKSWKKYRLCRENYNSITGEGGGQRYQSWGPLFALILLEDFIDYTPFEGLRIGNLSASKENRIENIKIRGAHYNLIADRNKLILFKNGKEILRFYGRSVLRNIGINERIVSFEVNVLSDSAKFYISFLKGTEFILSINNEKRKAKRNFNLKRGYYKIKIKKVNY